MTNIFDTYLERDKLVFSRQSGNFDWKRQHISQSLTFCLDNKYRFEAKYFEEKIKQDICEQSKRVQGPPVKADLSLRQDGATFQPFLSTRAGQQTNDREEDHDHHDG